MKIKILPPVWCIFIILSFCLVLDAQEGQKSESLLWQRELNAIVNGVNLSDAYTGGFGYSKPAFSDIDGDGDQDLFIGRGDGTLSFYRNDGTSLVPSWTFITDNYDSIDVGWRANPAFADIDGDGDLDLFIGESDWNINFYRNDGTANEPIWTFVTEDYNWIWVGSNCAPAFTDIDNDGDLDLFVGESDGNINYYRNDGTPAEPSWTNVTSSYNSVDAGSNSAPEFTDIDNDGDLDLFIGNSNGNIIFYRNDSTAENPKWILLTEYYNSIDIGNYSTPVFTDIDNDGDKDLFTGNGDGNINFYRNDGTHDVQLCILTDEFYDSIDVGSSSKPVFTDIDNDGDKDLFIGESDGNINFYRNDGNSSEPSWMLISENYYSIDVGYNSVPAFADIDSDGDQDLFIGTGNGNINFYRNDGTSSESSFVLVSESYNSINIGSYSTPAFADIDNDDDLDLFFGEWDGNINFYRNVGTPAEPSWMLVSENYNSIDIGYNSTPVFADIDGDDDLDLFIGGGYGNINFYRNDGTPAEPSWTLVTENYNTICVSYSGTPAFIDIDNDGDLDYLLGGADGNIIFYRSDVVILPVWTSVAESFNLLDVGSRSIPAFADIDDDGDKDLFIGEYDGNINFYRNDGTQNEPSWTLVSESYNLIDVGSYNAPVFADIDGDGDPDLFIGEYDGNINFYRNDGTSNEPLWTLVTENYNAIDMGYSIVPAFADIDGDGDLDLFIGEGSGNINFYRNDGTPNVPSWTLVTESFNSIDVGLYSTPAFADIDGDSDLDLFIGEEYGNIKFYRNDGTLSEPLWKLITESYSSIDVGSYSAPNFTDIDNDGDPDFFIGEDEGGINFWRKLSYQVDLMVEHIETSLICTTGDSIIINYSIKNQGADTAFTFTVNFYLSVDTLINVDDILSGSRVINDIAPLASFSESIKFPITIKQGWYYLGAITDVNEDVPEYNEVNNIEFYSTIIYVSTTGEYNVPPNLYGGTVIPDTGHLETEYIFLVNYTDADNDIPLYVNVNIDDMIPQGMTKWEGDGDFTNGELFEYRTKLSQGNHIFSFFANEGFFNALGDTYTHAGPVVRATNTSPVLSNGTVYPETGTPNTKFRFSVTYSDADNDTCSEILLHIDDHTPIPITPVNSIDDNYTDGLTYEYRTKLDAGLHTFKFSARDWSDLATGDTSVHSGPNVVLSGNAPVLTNGAVTPQAGFQDTVFTYSILYTSCDGLPPSAINVKIDDETHAMSLATGDTPDYSVGEIYLYETSLDTGYHTYAFMAESGGQTAGGDTTMHYGPVVLVSSGTFTPFSGIWSGITSQGNPIKFTVSGDGSKILNFHGSVETSFTLTINGVPHNFYGSITKDFPELNILNNSFSGSSTNFYAKFTGTFTSPINCSGAMNGISYTFYYPYGQILLSGEGTWEASPLSLININTPQNGILVNTPTIEVSGVASGPLVNNTKINDVPVELTNCLFSTSILLSEGDNTITLSAFNDSNQVVGTHSIVVTLDSSSPVVSITEPLNNLETSQQEVNVAGTVNDPSILYVNINGIQVCVAEGKFSTIVPLVLGDNSISAVCSDEAGNLGGDTIHVELLCMNNGRYLSEAICKGESYQVGDFIYAESGIYITTLQNQNGCDSIVTLNLTVIQEIETNQSADICQGESYTFGTQTLTIEGPYTEIFSSVHGCDSTVNLTLNVNPTFNEAASATICQGESYTFGTQTLTEAGPYTTTFPGVLGCDSTVVLTLIVNPTFDESLTASICQGESYTFGNQTLNTAGSYFEVFQNDSGCDSTVSLYLTVNSVDVSTSGELNVLFANNPNGTYQWIDCNGNTPVAGETNQSFTATANGSYAVIITQNMCTDTSECVLVTNLSMNEPNAGFFYAYPNPTTGKLTIEVTVPIVISLSDILGRKIQITKLNERENIIDLSYLPDGIYFIQTFGIKNSKSIKILKISYYP